METPLGRYGDSSKPMGHYSSLLSWIVKDNSCAVIGMWESWKQEGSTFSSASEAACREAWKGGLSLGTSARTKKKEYMASNISLEHDTHMDHGTGIPRSV